MQTPSTPLSNNNIISAIPPTSPPSSSVGKTPKTKTSKRKPYTKRACVACKAAHAACDDSRPCKRCVSLGIPHECIDAERKKSTTKRKPRKKKATSPTSLYPSMQQFVPYMGPLNSLALNPHALSPALIPMPSPFPLLSPIQAIPTTPATIPTVTEVATPQLSMTTTVKNPHHNAVQYGGNALNYLGNLHMANGATLPSFVNSNTQNAKYHAYGGMPIKSSESGLVFEENFDDNSKDANNTKEEYDMYMDLSAMNQQSPQQQQQQQEQHHQYQPLQQLTSSQDHQQQHNHQPSWSYPQISNSPLLSSPKATDGDVALDDLLPSNQTTSLVDDLFSDITPNTDLPSPLFPRSSLGLQSITSPTLPPMTSPQPMTPTATPVPLTQTHQKDIEHPLVAGITTLPKEVGLAHHDDDDYIIDIITKDAANLENQRRSPENPDSDDETQRTQQQSPVKASSSSQSLSQQQQSQQQQQQQQQQQSQLLSQSQLQQLTQYRSGSNVGGYNTGAPVRLGTNSTQNLEELLNRLVIGQHTHSNELTEIRKLINEVKALLISSKNGNESGKQHLTQN